MTHFRLSKMALLGFSAAMALTAACELTAGLHRDTGLRSGDIVKIKKIVKGDEVVIEKDGAQYRVRMLGISAFEPVIVDPYLDKYGKAATEYLAHYQDKTVTVFFDTVPKDEHGRYLGYVQAGDIDLNRDMVQQGKVAVYTEFAFGREQAYLEAEREARRQHQGIWENERTVPLITGLRKQWKQVRATHKDKLPADPLL